MNIMLVDIDQIIPAFFNPPSRTELKRLRELYDSMESRGFLTEFPIILGNDKQTIGDGHRRYTVAKKLGIQKVPVIYSELSAEDVYTLQTTSAKPTGKELLIATSRGVGNEQLPKGFRKQYSLIISLCGEKAIDYLVDRNLSPSVIDYVKNALNYIKRLAPEIEITPNFGFKVLEWVTSNNQAYRLRIFVENGENVQRLLDAIRNNKPLPRAY